MRAEEIPVQLERIASDDDFAAISEELADDWRASGAGIETVEPILRFMENHPSIDYGVPGALVHFVEDFYGNGYEDKLVESMKRKPTATTAWMLNRLINGTKETAIRKYLVTTLAKARLNPLADPNTVQRINHYLEGS